VTGALGAPLWAEHIAHSGPGEEHITDVVEVDGREVDVVSTTGVPIGPTWSARFMLGADANGRDEMVRLLYGARSSLAVGFGAAAISLVLGALLGVSAGYARGRLDAVTSWLFTVIWSFPVILLGVALGVSLALGGIDLGPVTIEGDSVLIPMVIIGVVFTPYVGRLLRARVISLREEPFVEAARAAGAGPLQVVRSEIAPHLAATLLALAPIMVANAILLEAGLSFLGAGVQPPNPSWGGMIADGIELPTSAPHLLLVPGLALVATVLAVNGIGDAIGRRLGVDVRTGRAG